MILSFIDIPGIFIFGCSERRYPMYDSGSGSGIGVSGFVQAVIIIDAIIAIVRSIRFIILNARITRCLFYSAENGYIDIFSIIDNFNYIAVFHRNFYLEFAVIGS